MSYMVMECHPGYAVVLDEGGRFLKVANRHYEVGQTVCDVVPMQVPARKPSRWLGSLAAVVACLALLLTVVLPVQGQPYASVYMKINPEIRIDVDKNDRVVGLEGVNTDGTALIQDYRYHKKDLETVTEELVDLAITAGFLQSDGQITLTLDSADPLWITDHKQTLSHHMHTHLQGHFTGTIEVSAHHEGHHVETPTELPQDTLTTSDDSSHHENVQQNVQGNEHHSKQHDH